MIPVSFSWDSRKRSMNLKWDGLLFLTKEEEKGVIKLFGVSFSFPLRKKRTGLPLRWIHLKGALSFLREWKLKKVEGTFSFPDPMVNGLLYGWVSAIESRKRRGKTTVGINFLGENWCSGEATISLKALLHHLRRWLLPFIFEMRRNRGERRKETVTTRR